MRGFRGCIKQAARIKRRGVNFAILPSHFDVAAPHEGRISDSYFVPRSRIFRITSVLPPYRGCGKLIHYIWYN
jgi:hypothetical protein